MIPDFSGLYSELSNGLLAIRLSPAGAMEKAEASFRLALSYWYRIKQWAEEHEFGGRNEEIGFFKTIKPGFTAAIEGCVLQYSGHLFEPSGDEQSKILYWENETNRAAIFLKANSGFRDYYFSGNTQKDAEYFTRCMPGKTWKRYCRSYPDSARSCSSHDHLVCLVKAYTEYITYTLAQVQVLQQQKCRPEPAFIPPEKNQPVTTVESLPSFAFSNSSLLLIN